MKEKLSKSKIKIVDDIKTRNTLMSIIDDQNEMILSKWAIKNAIRILNFVGYETKNNEMISKGVESNHLCNIHKMNLRELRQIGFKIHHEAKNHEDPLIQTALRAFGHAISVAHMKNHAIVSSDYIIKVLNLKFNNSLEKAVEERNFQLEELSKLILDK